MIKDTTNVPEAIENRDGWPWTEETDPSIYSKRDQWPKISVITPSYNQGSFIEETIRSVLCQWYPNLEYLIIDGGSTDETVKIIKHYENLVDYWVSESDNGQTDAINKGLRRSTGLLIGWLNSDDYLLPKALYQLAEAYLRNERSDGAYLGRGYKINGEGERIYSPDPEVITTNFLIRWMEGNNFMQPACYWTRGVQNKVGYLSEQYNYCMDLEYWIRISQQFPFYRFNADFAHAYAHDEAKTTKDKPAMAAETLYMVSKYEGSKSYVVANIEEYILKAEELEVIKKRLSAIPFWNWIAPLLRWILKLER